MGNVSNSNSIFVDSTGALSIGTNQNIKIAYIVMTTTAATGSATLQDDAPAPVDKLIIKEAIADKTIRLNFADNPINFPNGIRISALSNATLTLILRRDT